MYSNNRISNLIKTQLPFFVRNDHPNFILFLEAYYEYLEQNEKTINRAKNLRIYRDVDLTEDQFSVKLYDTFMKYIPSDVIADKNLIIKHIKDFYRAKGTEKATKFLMRILYDIEIDFYYPKKDILRASDGKWYIQKSLRITDTQISNVTNTSINALEKYVGNKITGQTSNASAIIESVDRFYEQGTLIDELVLSNINGNFKNGEKILTSFIEIDTTKTISSNVYGGIVNSITVSNGGTGYLVGDPVLIVSNTGSGACASIASVTTGNIAFITVYNGGAGYQNNANVIITGGGGSGATARVTDIDLTERYHPNSYNIVSSTINLEANTAINNTVYSNLNSSNANVAIANAVSYWTYSNTGPIRAITVLTAGNNYTSIPTLAVEANTTIIQLGILGRIDIYDGGQNYQIGDLIEFNNVPGGYGVGALANVTNVNQAASNSINEVKFIKMPGHIIGGSGYDSFYLPKANVISTTGNGANIVVRSILGAGANVIANTSSIGTIQRIVITNRGINYGSNTIVNLTNYGDGKAQANISIVEGVYTYPGKYLNDDGHISSYNFLQDRDYYQNFSYVIRSSKSVSSYRNTVKNIIHPSGMKMFGEYMYLSQPEQTTCPCDANDSISKLTTTKTYQKIGNTINVSYISHGLDPNTNVTLEFLSGGYSNVQNGIYMIDTVSTNYFYVKQKSSISNISILNAGSQYNSNSYLVFTGDGYGANASYTTNANGSIVSVTINEPGINFTTAPTVNANGSNAVSATFIATIEYANNTSGNVLVGIYRS